MGERVEACVVVRGTQVVRKAVKICATLGTAVHMHKWRRCVHGLLIFVSWCVAFLSGLSSRRKVAVGTAVVLGKLGSATIRGGVRACKSTIHSIAFTNQRAPAFLGARYIAIACVRV